MEGLVGPEDASLVGPAGYDTGYELVDGFETKLLEEVDTYIRCSRGCNS